MELRVGETRLLGVSLIPLSARLARAYDQRDVILLLAWTEVSDVRKDRFHALLWRELAMASQHFDQMPFSELLSISIAGFGYAVGIECKGVSGEELAFADRAVP